MAEPSHNISRQPVIPFTFDEQMIRVVNRNGEVWFFASDIAEQLDYREAFNLTRVLDEDEAAPHTVRIRSADGTEQTREITIISESGLYHAVMKSRKPEAKRFRKWVTSEVLPAIRRSGRFATGPTEMPQDLTLEAMKALAKTRFMFRIDPFDGNRINIMPLSDDQRLVDIASASSIRDAISSMDKQAISVVYQEIGRVLLENSKETVTFSPRPITQPDTRERRAIRALLRVMPPGVDVGRTCIVNAVKGTLNASEIDQTMEELKAMGVVEERRNDPDGPGRPPVFYRRVG